MRYDVDSVLAEAFKIAGIELVDIVTAQKIIENEFKKKEKNVSRSLLVSLALLAICTTLVLCGLVPHLIFLVPLAATVFSIALAIRLMIMKDLYRAGLRRGDTTIARMLAQGYLKDKKEK